MLGTESLSALRASLEEEREQLQAQLADLGVGGEAMAFDENFADSGQVAAEQGENRVRINQTQDTLEQVEWALTKLAQGRYGTCEICGQEIAEPRLEAMPAARLCIGCASRR